MNRRVVATMLMGLAFDAMAVLHQSEVTLTPLTPPSLAIPKGEARTIHYQLVNHSRNPYYLMMKPMAGIEQQLDKEYCQENIELKAGQACTLSLLVSATGNIGLKKQGPILCEDSHDWLEGNMQKNGFCVQPREEEQISVQEIAHDHASFSIEMMQPVRLNNGKELGNKKRCFTSLAGCPLIMFQNSGVAGSLKITNNSSNPLYNLTVSSLPSGITQDANNRRNCALISPGGSCTLKFYPGSIRYQNATITLSGSNTKASSVGVQVLGIGDTYNGNQLFQLPTTSSPNFYVAAPANIPGGEMMLAAAVAACTGGYVVPAIAQLTNLYTTSECNGGPITGFAPCNAPASIYWSTTAIDPNDVFAIDFNTGITIPRPRDQVSLGRCILAYALIP